MFCTQRFLSSPSLPPVTSLVLPPSPSLTPCGNLDELPVNNDDLTHFSFPGVTGVMGHQILSRPDS